MINFLADDATREMLNDLVKFFRVNQSKVIRTLILEAHEKLPKNS
jgi:hypothetical protein